MRPQRYSQKELAWMEENHALSVKEFHARFRDRFRADATLEGLASARLARGWKTGRTCYFEKGNKPGWIRRGLPVGSERVSHGFLIRKVCDKGPKSKLWKRVHHINWEVANGPIPPGMRLKCKGDRLDTNPSNWELIENALTPLLNGGNGLVKYDDAPSELKPAIMAAAKLKRVVQLTRAKMADAQ